MTDHSYTNYSYQNQHGRENNNKNDDNPHLLNLKRSLASFTASVAEDAAQLRSHSQHNSKIMMHQQRQHRPTKEHQRTSLQFLSKQLQRLSQIEQHLLHLTDQALVTSDNNNSANGGSHVMTMEELSSTCRMLHSHHAKYLIQIEEILHDRFGYVKLGTSNQEYDQTEEGKYKIQHQNQSENDVTKDKENSNNYAVNVNNASTSTNTSNDNYHKNNNTNTEQIIINPLIGQPLNRLSEAEVETDIGSSCCTASTNTPSTSRSRGDSRSRNSSLSLSSPSPRPAASSSSSTNRRNGMSLPYIKNGAVVTPKEFLNNTTIATTTPTTSITAVATATSYDNSDRLSTNCATSNTATNSTNENNIALDENQEAQQDDTNLKSSFSSLKISDNSSQDILQKDDSTSHSDHKNLAMNRSINNGNDGIDNNSTSTSNRHDRKSFASQQQYSKINEEYLNLLVQNHKKNKKESYNNNIDNDNHNQSVETSMELLDDMNDYDGTVSMASTVLCERKRNEYGMFADDDDDDNNDCNGEENNCTKEVKEQNRDLSELEEGCSNSKMKELIEASIQYMNESYDGTSYSGYNGCDDNDDSTTHYLLSKNTSELCQDMEREKEKRSDDEKMIDHEHDIGSNVTTNTTRASTRTVKEMSADSSASTMSHIDPTTITSDLIDATNGQVRSSHTNRRKQTLDSVSRALHATTSSSDIEEPNISKEEEGCNSSSPLDKFEVRLLNGGRDVKVVSYKAKPVDVLKNISPKKIDTTSPFDRFQVQVMNGGTEAKVTPIEKEFLGTTQSPISKINSPLLKHSGTMVNNYSELHKENSYESEMDVDPSHVKSQTPSEIKSRKVYPKTPIPKAEKDAYLLNSSILVSHDESTVIDLLPRQSTIQKEYDQCKTPLDVNKKKTTSTVRTPLAAAWIKKNISGDKDRLLKVLSGGKGIPPSPSLPSCSSSFSSSASSLSSFQSSSKRIEDVITPCKERNTSETNQQQAETSVQKEKTQHKSTSMISKGGEKYLNKGCTKINIKVKSDPKDETSSSEQHTIHKKKSGPIKSISSSEYDTSPRVVQMQVTYDELNHAVDVLNEWTNVHMKDNDKRNNDGSFNNGQLSLNLGEKEANSLLEKEFNVSRKAKSILMSLCFFRRITLQLLPGGKEGKHFVIPLN